MPMNEMTRPAASQVADRIDRVKVSYAVLPLAQPVSDAKVLTGRQKPLTEIAFVFAEIGTRDGHEGMGFGYSKRAGGPGISRSEGGRAESARRGPERHRRRSRPSCCGPARRSAAAA